jgi:hypothetical protein
MFLEVGGLPVLHILIKCVLMFHRHDDVIFLNFVAASSAKKLASLPPPLIDKKIMMGNKVKNLTQRSATNQI